MIFKKLFTIILTVLSISFFLVIFYFIFIMMSGYGVKKPVIYLYPEQEEEIIVKINYDGELACTYPKYNDGWYVKASPDGQLINLYDNKEYSYLFWEGKDHYKWNLESGFVVEGSKTEEFLQEKLAFMGLTPREYNEFIVYWLPLMEGNKYNLIYFAGDEYENLAQLDIEPIPDSILRVFMVYKPLTRYIDIDEQELERFKREGFTVIEWGGTQIK